MAPEGESKKVKCLSAVLRSEGPPDTAETVISIPEYLAFAPQSSYSPRACADRSSDVGPVDDVFFEAIDVSLGGQSEKSNGRTSKKGGANTLEAILPVPENTIRIYCTHNVANNELRSHLRNSGITDESLLDILVPDVDQVDLSSQIAIPSLRSICCAVEGELRTFILPSYVICSPTAQNKMVVRSTSRVDFGFLPGNSVVVLCRMQGKVDIPGFESKSVEVSASRSRAILSDKSFTSLLNSTRNLAIQAVVLDLLSVLVVSMEPVIYFLLSYGFLPEIMSDPSTLSSHIVRSLLFDGITETAESIDHAVIDIRKHLEASSGSGLDSALQELNDAISENLKMAKHLGAKENRRYELLKGVLDFQQSLNMTRLTTLASVLLPVSLAAGLLSMQTRASQLGLLLYDFAGICIILGTLVLLTYPIMSRTMTTFNRRSWYSENLMVMDSLTLSRIKFPIRILEYRKRWYFALAIYIWGVVVASFLVGMSHSVPVGVKILGFGVAAGVATFFLITLVVLLLELRTGTEGEKKSLKFWRQLMQQIPQFGYWETL